MDMENHKLPDGLYEELVSDQLKKRLNTFDESDVLIQSVDESDAPASLADYAARAIKHSLSIMNDNGQGIVEQTHLVNKLLEIIRESVNDAEAPSLSEPAEQLKAILTNPIAKAINQNVRTISRPETSIAFSSLFTGASREPNMAGELAKEIESCDRIDMLVSFIRWSGVTLIWDELKRFTDSGKKLRIITTSYMGATELRAIVALSKLQNTEIRISYDTERTRLHAKSYIFYRETGYSTAYVGSSNLTNPAMTSGCEWNVKVTKADLPDVFDKVVATFEAYWHSPDFEEYNDSKLAILKAALEDHSKRTAGTVEKRIFYFEPSPYQYQQAILDKLTAEREIHQSYRNLVVAATGTGKTIIAAFDYKRQCEKHHRKLKLLFVAHRKEILEQSIECFREVMRDSQFGDMFVGQHIPLQYDYLFVSVDMLNSRNFSEVTSPDQYEYIVLDECHHSAAKSYQMLIDYYTPSYLLGLTATPERMDGISILPFFNNRIAAEIRLPEAINRKLLCPFQYFCIADTVNLDTVKWARGGYDRAELENLYVFSREIATKRAKMILNSMIRYIADLSSMKGLVFCVSVEHAKFMSQFFNEYGIPSRYLAAAISEDDRAHTKAELENGEISLVCVVDLYNEGVDIKSINTVLFLRPTESLTVFLQQLGRGLRLSEGKDCLTVLDFIGQANKKYRYDVKFNALFQSNSQGIKKEIEDGFPHLPRGCYIKLEKTAREHIFSNIRNAITSPTGMIESLISFEFDSGMPLTLANFLTYYSIPARELYGQKLTVSQYRIDKASLAGADREMWKKLYRFSSVDSIDLLNYCIGHFELIVGHENDIIPGNDLSYWKVLYSTFISDTPIDDNHVVQAIRDYWKVNSVFVDELKELIEYSKARIGFISHNASLPYDCVLQVYCTYTRAQALSAFDYWRTSSEGVTRIPSKKTTCLFITLNKSNSYYSPSTAYHDYSISDKLFHWQSQNATSETTEVGQRYIDHVSQGETILLFVRDAKQDRFGSIPFTFLGKAYYKEHTGNKPMNIIWELENPIPANFIKITDKLGVG